MATANIGYFNNGGISVVERIRMRKAVIAMLAVGFFLSCPFLNCLICTVSKQRLQKITRKEKNILIKLISFYTSISSSSEFATPKYYHRIFNPNYSIWFYKNGIKNSSIGSSTLQMSNSKLS